MRRRVTTLALLAAAAALAIAVVVDAVRGGGSEAPPRRAAAGDAADDLLGPNSPEPGALGGRLVVVRGERCVLQVVDLELLRLGKAGPTTSCDLAVSPDGAQAITSDAEYRGRRRVQLQAAELGGDRPRVVRELGTGLFPVAWLASGREIAHCTERGATRRIDVGSGEGLTVPGCPPAFAADGTLLTLAAGQGGGDARLLADGDAVVDVEALVEAPAASALPPRIYALDVGRSGIGALVMAGGRGAEQAPVVVVWGGGPGQVIRLGEDSGLAAESPAASFVRVSPTGRELVLGLGGSGRIALLDVISGRVVLGPLAQRGFDWSPDGSWFAVSNGRAIDVYGTVRSSTPAFTIPLAASALAWRPPLDD
jgi:hypothetical protein